MLLNLVMLAASTITTIAVIVITVVLYLHYLTQYSVAGKITNFMDQFGIDPRRDDREVQQRIDWRLSDKASQIKVAKQLYADESSRFLQLKAARPMSRNLQKLQAAQHSSSIARDKLVQLEQEYADKVFAVEALHMGFNCHKAWNDNFLQPHDRHDALAFE